MTLTAHRAIYDTFSHQRGAEPDFVSDQTNNELVTLLHAGDRALDRTEGYFFGTINGQFVVCFEQKRKDAHSRGKSMAYFDVFWLPVADLKDSSLHDLIKSLRELRSNGYNAEISEMTEVAVAELDELVSQSEPAEASPDSPAAATDEPTETKSDHSEGQPTETSPNSGSDDGFVDASSLNSNADSDAESQTPDTENTNPEKQIRHPEAGSLRPPSSRFIAQLWEQYRRDGTHMSADLRDLDRFHYRVTGTPETVRGISEAQQQTDKFDVIITERSKELSLSETDLVALVEELQTEHDQIDVDDLPTYHDELKQKAKTHKENIRDPTEMFDLVDDRINSLQTTIERLIRQQNEHSSEVYHKALAGEWSEDDEDDGRLSSFSSLTDVVSGDDAESYEFLDDLELSETDQETVDYVVDEILDSSSQQDLQPQLEEAIDKFKHELLRLAEQSEERSAKRVIRAIEDIRTSTAYERAPDEAR